MVDTTQTFTPIDGEEKVRLDRWLPTKLGISRSAVQRLIHDGCVTVNGKAAIAHELTRVGQNIRVQIPELNRRHKVLIPRVMNATSDYLIIEKPSGLLVHPNARGGETTLVEWLLEKYPDIQNVGEAGRPGIVHRLDREVSGLLVVARTPDSFVYLQNEFRERRVKKQYTALVHGAPEQETGEIRFPLARSLRSRSRMAARPIGGEGRDALTRYTVLRRYAHASLLAVIIETGRTHQIRAHLFAIGHPIVGDHLYRYKRHTHLPDVPRVFLHSSELGFFDPQHVWQQYRSPLPEELQSVLNALNGERPPKMTDN